MTLREELVARVINEARETHRARSSYTPFLERTNPLAFIEWEDRFLDRNVRLSVAVEKLEAFERQRGTVL